jgi:hypothetical protein
MVCILTYFFKVSKLYFAIFAFVFETINLFIKLYCNLNDKEHVEQKNEEDEIADKIHVNLDEGDKD